MGKVLSRLSAFLRLSRAYFQRQVKDFLESLRKPYSPITSLFFESDPFSGGGGKSAPTFRHEHDTEILFFHLFGNFLGFFPILAERKDRRAATGHANGKWGELL